MLSGRSAEGGCPLPGSDNYTQISKLGDLSPILESSDSKCFFSLFLRAACGGEEQEEQEIGAQPQTPGEGLPPFTIPLRTGYEKMCILVRPGSGVSPENLFSLFLRAATGGEHRMKEGGAQPQTPGQGLPPLTIPLKYAPMGQPPSVGVWGVPS